ncbi:carbohydrate esterase family 4 protein [Athelia psychrophila]|uniref:chitin deacetylase n=1 Tax=Athelia psychrophila TaxID=1759441 RepID=A0A166VSS8_9AGAM|nr:carbohydrate esterase family 4 protein [Fibularhizoctonia sp. CBS 109695]
MLHLLAVATLTLFASPLAAGAWSLPEDHHAYSLFRRAPASSPTDGVTYPTVGSSAWYNAYPQDLASAVSTMPQAWVTALNAAVAAGKIPSIPPTTMGSNGVPVYPAGYDPTSPTVCSGSEQCRIPSDIWDAPSGTVGCGFDDGPLPPTSKLLKYLKEQKQHATHFFIGLNIINNAKEFLATHLTNQDDIAVHTWTHPYMTTLTNLELVAEFGWTMEVIHNSTGGRLPAFWRPPYGDTDMRVHAIAKVLFGLTGILWNHDTNDWSLTTGGTTSSQISQEMDQWLTGPHSPGLIILEHELSTQSVQAFIDNYPKMKANGWTVVSDARLSGQHAYQNSIDASKPVTRKDSVLVNSKKRSLRQRLEDGN